MQSPGQEHRAADHSGGLADGEEREKEMGWIRPFGRIGVRLWGGGGGMGRLNGREGFEED